MHKVKDINGLYDLYYAGNIELRNIIRIHSEQVAKKALQIIEHRQLPVNREFVYSAALLHDIGVVKCNAPDIHALGNLPYICHGVEGRKMLESQGLPEYALVCERHTGSGISKYQIIHQNLPLPLRDMLPVSMEEKLICYADKFYSKSHDLTKEKSLDEIKNQIRGFGKDAFQRFMQLHDLFS